MASDEKLGLLEDAISGIKLAMEYLNECPDFADFAAALGDVISDMKPMQAELEEMVIAAERAESDAMNREYWASVI